MIRAAALSLALLPASAALAHPHIFIDAGLRIEVDESGRAVAVEVTWAYDELYSLLIFEEYKLDSDYDGRLRDDEIKLLYGFDTHWVEGFEGDLYITSASGEKVKLGAPEPAGLAVEKGQIITTHRRAIDVDAQNLVLQVYDPGFYSAYELTRGVEVTGGGCAAFIDPADTEAAMEQLEELMFARPQADLDNNFPEVGETFADTVTLTCSN